MIDALRSDDLPQLLHLFANDPEGGWAPGGWTDDDVRFVLQLRLEHYAKYGFGVYAIRNQSAGLMGMAGAQVWIEDEPSDVEVVAFIGREYWRRGLADTVLTYVISELAAADLPRVLATTRPDNVKSAGMLTKLGFSRSGRVHHWEVDAVLWERLLGADR